MMAREAAGRKPPAMAATEDIVAADPGAATVVMAVPRPVREAEAAAAVTQRNSLYSALLAGTVARATTAVAAVAAGSAISREPSRCTTTWSSRAVMAVLGVEAAVPAAQ